MRFIRGPRKSVSKMEDGLENRRADRLGKKFWKHP